MNYIPAQSRISKRIVSSLLALTLLVALLPVASAPVQAPRVQPLLLQMAAEHPDQVVSIIVQKAAKDAAVEEKVAALGGTVTQDLHIINAFAAELKAKDVPQLARAAAVRWVSLDAVVTSTACAQCVDTTNLTNAYIRAIRADQVWNNSPYLQGQGVTVAVVDSGINTSNTDFNGSGTSRILSRVEYLKLGDTNDDSFGHGTHVAGVIGGNGSTLKGKYIGVAPKVNLLSVKVSNILSAAMESNVIAGLQWIYDNRAAYNIRVVNISLNASGAQSYQTSPLDAACELLWFNGIVVVTSAGNASEGAIYPPANDPFVITVGAADDMGTPSLTDDVVASFSAYGKTKDGFSKPDLVAPGRGIVSALAGTSSVLAKLHPDRIIDKSYFSMSGTSAAAPMVAGAAALLLQDEPGLNPDQVKYRLMATANKTWPGYSATTAGAGYLDIYAAVRGTTTQSANTGTAVSNLLTTGPDSVLGLSVSWNSVSWNSVSWNSVSWNSVSWNSVSWNSVSWNSDYWEQGAAVIGFADRLSKGR